MHTHLGINCIKIKSCLFMLWLQCYLGSHFMSQLLSHSRGAALRSSISCHPVFVFPDHLLRQCSTPLSWDTQRHSFVTSLCAAHLPVTPNDLQWWKSCYCSFGCPLFCCELGIIPVRFLCHGLHEGDLEMSWSSLWKIRGRKTHAWIYNSRVVRAQEMRPRGQVAIVSALEEQLEPALLTAGESCSQQTLVEAVVELSLLLFF